MTTDVSISPGDGRSRPAFDFVGESLPAVGGRLRERGRLNLFGGCDRERHSAQQQRQPVAICAGCSRHTGSAGAWRSPSSLLDVSLRARGYEDRAAARGGCDHSGDSGSARAWSSARGLGRVAGASLAAVTVT